MKIKITNIILPDGANAKKYKFAIELLKSAEYPKLTKDQIYSLVEKTLNLRPIHIEYQEIS